MITNLVFRYNKALFFAKQNENKNANIFPMLSSLERWLVVTRNFEQEP